ncbi:trypsin 5G1-like [Choristoneura fumiferana]|uniref:trypsin 5G1-like n=1 Tax=Choristoneura fumiferana TaxID=7141 RepID=UPI003D155BBB
MWQVCFIAFCVSAERQFARPRVYLGLEDTNKEFPFVVSMLRRNGSRVGTCNLIAQNWLITSGHSVRRGSINRIIKYADMTSKNTSAYSELIKVFRHPSFFFSKIIEITAINDLALVLIEKVPIKTIAKLSAIDYKSLIGLPVKYAGFGNTGKVDKLPVAIMEGDDIGSLQVGEAVVVKCPSVYPIFGPAICIAPKCSEKFQDTRDGYGGGPLMYMGKIVGVIVASETEKPIGYVTPVSPNLNWINYVMKNET